MNKVIYKLKFYGSSWQAEEYIADMPYPQYYYADTLEEILQLIWNRGYGTPVIRVEVE